MYQRICKPLLSKSFFLFGARGTGKSTLLHHLLGKTNCLELSLLNTRIYADLLRDPQLLEEWVLAKDKKNLEWVILDEIQKVPALLNVVHQLLESQKKIKFALTGSSARKLKRGGANLLAGRAFLNYLFPLTPFELKADFDLKHALAWGSLPELSALKGPQEKEEYLKSYVGTYVREEIKEEQVVRNVDPFIKFLEVSAQMSGEILNFSKIGRDAGVDGKAIERYYEILTDTLLGFFLAPYDKSLRKRQTQKAKFYLFDLGIKKALEGRVGESLESTYGYGKDFEHFILQNIIALNSYYRKDYRFSYLRTKDNMEIDLIIEKGSVVTHLIEIKSTSRVDEAEIKKLSRLKADFLNKPEAWILSQETRERKSGDIFIFPWQRALEKIFLD